jgi:hypothetical protein
MVFTRSMISTHAAVATLSQQQQVPVKTYNLRPRQERLTVTVTVHPYNLRPRVTVK